MSELEAIATDPDCQHYFPVDVFNDLSAIIDAIEDSACDGELQFVRRAGLTQTRISLEFSELYFG